MGIVLTTDRLVLRQLRPPAGHPTDEISRALVDKAFTDRGARRVYADAVIVNTASRRVLEKAGLTLIRTYHTPGEELDEVEYAITRPEWQATRSSREQRCTSS